MLFETCVCKTDLKPEGPLEIELVWYIQCSYKCHYFFDIQHSSMQHVTCQFSRNSTYGVIDVCFSNFTAFFVREFGVCNEFLPLSAIMPIPFQPCSPQEIKAAKPTNLEATDVASVGDSQFHAVTLRVVVQKPISKQIPNKILTYTVYIYIYLLYRYIL